MPETPSNALPQILMRWKKSNEQALHDLAFVIHEELRQVRSADSSAPGAPIRRGAL